MGKSIWKWTKRGFLTLIGLIAFYAIYGAIAYRATDARSLYKDSGIRYAQIEDASIAYRYQGEDKTGPAVILVHSMFFDMAMWDDWAAELAKTNPVIRFDVAGHGLSSQATSGDYSLKATMKTLQGIMDHHGVKRAILVGSSMGGATVFNYAAANPLSVEKLILVNPGGLEGYDKKGSATAPDWAYWILRYLPDSALDAFVNWLSGDNDTGDIFRNHFQVSFRNKGTREGIVGRMQDFKSHDTATVLPQLTMPTLLMWGEKNVQLPVAQADQFYELISKGSASVTVKIYPGSGHMTPVEKIDKPLEDVKDFIQAQEYER
ncbi:alpha/beta hydrolase [Temperatibacter marinus]|uniref:Alpha/beta hydrolase n=1 Tax=Temperatibacter marinus TaxID=1456591 RepID=A0AA52EJP3_9PROT|nr:alpha/beta hydrolase [Temperatibacter marinus]WND03509.1 alpha/beta hydrolase [Temperatibacter marinus]